MAEKKKINFGEMSKGELEKFIEEKENRMIKIRFDISSKQIKNHREYRNIKRDIARAVTFLRNKQN